MVPLASPAFFVILISVPLYAQLDSATVRGVVRDVSGAVIPKVRVVLAEQSTNTKQFSVSAESGDFEIPYVKPGAYTIEFEAPGFKKYIETGILLAVNQNRSVDPVLEIGRATDVVWVRAAVAQVDCDSPEIGQIVDADQLANLPELASTKGRSPLQLAKLVPGVTTNGITTTNINNFSFAGGRRVTNDILVDGVPTTNPSDETYTYTPSPDSIQEFRVLTTPFSVEYGHTGGGVALATSRYGTNALHGRAYDLFRNRLLNGRDFFAPTRSATRYVQNDPGGVLGGPIVIPKLYDGRNKTFFFVDMNITLAAQGNVYSQIVPTDMQKNGDFSQTFLNGVNGQLLQIYDPLTAHTAANGTINRDPFAGNIIPLSRIDTVAAQILKLYPAPTSASSNNYVITPPFHFNAWQYLGRVDQNFGAADRAFFRFGQYSPNSSMTANIPNNANNAQASGWTDTHAVLGETHIFGPAVVNNFRAGFAEEDNYTSAGGGPAPQLGLKGVSLDSFPTINVSQMITLGSGAPSHDRDRSWVFNDDVTWQKGRNTFKFGGDFRRQMYDNYNPGKLSGSYSFTGTFTSLTPNASTSGFGLADLLLGAPEQTSINIDDYTFRENINSASAFAQDHFKIGHLNINLGVRWEFDGPYSEANNQFASFNPNVMNPQTGNLGVVQFAGRDGAPRHFSPNIYHDFQPRIGFAWAVLPDTVLRGGYGIYRLPSIGYWSYGPVSQYGVNATFLSPNNNVTPAYFLASGVPPYSYNVDATGLPNIPASFVNPTSNVMELETRARTPYNQTWQLGVQRRFRGDWMAEVNYVGTKGTKLPIALPINQLPESEWGASNNPQQLRPFPQYLTVTSLTNDGNSFYNALQSSLRRRWGAGVLSFAYTWSKTTDNVDAPSLSVPIQNVYNLKGEHGLAAYDVPQRFVASTSTAFPWAEGAIF